MKIFDRDIYFRKSWRSYQRRVLDDLQEHLDDHHLHIVAAPGSGKTILGLEVVRRLGKPALIFSPTLTIRDQWGERFVSLFCPDGYDTESLISKDLQTPKLLTLSSYQGLHSAYTGNRALSEKKTELGDTSQSPGNKKKLIKTLKAHGIGTIVVDEAHHLRNEWWKCLLDLKKQLGKPCIVALTATPPVDVRPWEWERYQEMCGPIDTEITVPELVKERNLCPHQDYIYFSSPTKNERQTLNTFRENVKLISQQIISDSAFSASLASYPYVNHPRDYLEEILADPAFFSSIVIYLWHVRKRHPRKLMHILGVRGKKIPKLNYEWMEILLTGCLYRYSNTFPQGNGLSDEIVDSLKRIGALEKRAVQFRTTPQIKKLLASSISKLDSILKIVDLESQSLHNALRMVILTDYIRKADLPKTNEDLRPLKRIGVIPIFEKLRRNRLGIRLGVLSGSLVILPAGSIELFRQIAQDHAIDYKRINFVPLACDNEYVTVGVSGTVQSGVVKTVTSLFNQGGITVLVGTKSLLGEGWDAPSVNSLILASFVGSYMLSNQMRGRAIRTQDGNPDKTSNIWHLVCVEDGAGEGSDDYAMITRRFRSYAGISFKDTAITNGLERLAIGKPPYSNHEMKVMNQQMAAYATDRAGMRRRWIEAFGADETAQMVEELQTPNEFLPSRLIFTKTIKALLFEGFLAAVYVFSLFYYQSDSDTDTKFVVLFFCAAFGLSALAALPFCIKALYLFIRYGPIALSMRQIGRALLDSLVYTGDIKTPKHKMGVSVKNLEGGYVSCSLSGATTYEKSLFLDALQEILNPIENPRYILMRTSVLWGLLRKDYHAVPALLGKRRETADFFTARWKKYLGTSHLIYSRSIEGRRTLLKARNTSMSSSFQKRSQRRNSWK